MNALLKVCNSIQRSLFPMLEEETGPWGERHQEWVRGVEWADLGRWLGPYAGKLRGRKRKQRGSIATVFVAQAVWNLPTTADLIQRLRVDRALGRLCGWNPSMDVASPATFSRAFAELASGQLPQRIREARVRWHHGNKLAGHVSRDATAIEGREKPARKEPRPPKTQKKRRVRYCHELMDAAHDVRSEERRVGKEECRL